MPSPGKKKQKKLELPSSSQSAPSASLKAKGKKKEGQGEGWEEVLERLGATACKLLQLLLLLFHLADKLLDMQPLKMDKSGRVLT